MAEYIDRQEAIDSLLGWAAQLTETYGKNDEYVRCLESAAYNIEQIPAADVWEVVHCADCLDKMHRQAADAIENLQKRVPKRLHGRLIDADALAEKHRELAYELRGANYDFHMTARSWVNSAPTIIPAEEGE